jgi:RNA polymerase sigma-70 factor (family 1)
LIPTDSELVVKLKEGEVKAFEMLYLRYAVNLYRFAFKYLRSKEEAEELVQAVFLKIWEIKGTLKTETSFKSFIYTIVYNDMCVIFRKRKYNQEYLKESFSSASCFVIENEEDRIDSKSQLERVEQILENLPEKQKSVFIKSRYEGKSTKDIAIEVGLSPGTVDNYISATIKLIKEKLKKESFYKLTEILLITSCFFN